jgi:hypothetical protein
MLVYQNTAGEMPSFPRLIPCINISTCVLACLVAEGRDTGLVPHFE